ncbi:hypothetical protein [Yoonia sp. MH D7]
MPPAPAHHYKATYRAADLEKLVSDFAIPDAQRDGLGPLLEDLAAIWRWKQPPATAIGTAAKSAAALQRVAKLADQLGTALGDLPPSAQDALRLTYASTGSAMVLAMNDDAISHGAAFSVPQADGSQQIIELQQDDIHGLVAHISAMALQAADLPAGQAGAKRDHGLKLWVANVEAYWTQTLGRSFSRDVTSTGEPISEAARFCVAAFAPVSAETLPSRVLQEMKLCIKATREKSTGRITPQNDA